MSPAEIAAMCSGFTYLGWRGGYIYAVEFTDGTVKVGATNAACRRLQSLRAFAARYGIDVLAFHVEPYRGHLHPKEREAINMLAAAHGPAAYGREWFSGIGIRAAIKAIRAALHRRATAPEPAKAA